MKRAVKSLRKSNYEERKSGMQVIGGLKNLKSLTQRNGWNSSNCRGKKRPKRMIGGLIEQSKSAR